MKNIFKIVIVLFAFVSTQSHANNKDRIVKLNGDVISGEIIKIGNNHFKIITNDSKVVRISNDDIGIVSFAQELSDFEKMKLGELDGKRYAKRKGGNIALGFFTGLIGTGIVYLTSSQYPAYEAMNGSNKAIIGDPAYIEGYEKGARAKSGGNALIGTAAWVLLLLLASAGV